MIFFGERVETVTDNESKGKVKRNTATNLRIGTKDKKRKDEYKTDLHIKKI